MLLKTVTTQHPDQALYAAIVARQRLAIYRLYVGGSVDWHLEGPMAAGPGIRIGDAERERTAASLREHFATGRLTSEEFNQRLDGAFAAKTDLDLDQLTADLPSTDHYAPPWPPSQPASSVMPSRGRRRRYYSSGSRNSTSAGRPLGYARISISLVVIACALLIFAWPLAGLPKIVLLVLAILAFARRIMRIFTGRRR